MCSKVKTKLGYCPTCGHPRDTFYDGDDTPFERDELDQIIKEKNS